MINAFDVIYESQDYHYHSGKLKKLLHGNAQKSQINIQTKNLKRSWLILDFWWTLRFIFQ